MTNRTNSDKARVHASRSWICPCGRRVFGNGGKSSHQRACLIYVEQDAESALRILEKWPSPHAERKVEVAQANLERLRDKRHQP